MATSAICWKNGSFSPSGRAKLTKPLPLIGSRGLSLDPGSSRPARLIVAASKTGSDNKRFYWNITGFPFPLGPFLQRKTIRKEVIKDSIWTFEQEQALGFSSVCTNIRMTVIKLDSGGLWVHAPIAPTTECVQLLKELQRPVEFIILPTFAYEHKVYVGPFSRNFPRAQVWVTPGQWSWPLNLPVEFFGIFSSRTLRDEDSDSVPWASEIAYRTLSSPEVGIGPYVEVAFFHKRSRTLLVTDAVIYVPETPPEVVSKESLLASARNGLAVRLLSKGKEVLDEPVVDNARNRQKGWERMVLQILFLGPSNLLEPKYTFSQVAKRLIVSPIVKTLVFNKVPEKVRDWIDFITETWKFRQIIPAHFAAPIRAGPRELEAAFSFVDELLEEADDDRDLVLSSLRLGFSRLWNKAGSIFSAEDMKTLSSLDDFLVSLRVVKKTVSR